MLPAAVCNQVPCHRQRAQPRSRLHRAGRYIHARWPYFAFQFLIQGVDGPVLPHVEIMMNATLIHPEKPRIAVHFDQTIAGEFIVFSMVGGQQVTVGEDTAAEPMKLVSVGG